MLVVWTETHLSRVRLGFGLVNQPEYGPLLYSFHYYYCDILVLALVGYFWPNTCGSRPHLVSTMDIGFEELLTKSVIGDRL